MALDQIAKGSDVVFQVAGGCGLGALDAASEKSVWGIGVDADQAFLGDHVLTSALKRVDQAVFQTIDSLVARQLHGRRRTIFGLAEEASASASVSPNAPQDAIDKTMGRSRASSTARSRCRTRSSNDEQRRGAGAEPAPCHAG